MHQQAIMSNTIFWHQIDPVIILASKGYPHISWTIKSELWCVKMKQFSLADQKQEPDMSELKCNLAKFHSPPKKFRPAIILDNKRELSSNQVFISEFWNSNLQRATPVRQCGHEYLYCSVDT